MAQIKAQSLGTLDLLRRRHGDEAVRNAFYDLCSQDSEQAAQLLNAEHLKFPTLFVLHAEIEKFALHDKLNQRNTDALNLCGCLCNLETAMQRDFGLDDAPTLRWMLATGYDEDDLGENYDEVLDYISILLAREHHDRTVLPYLCEMVFLKNRRGLYTYDAIWALFESQDPSVLTMVADRLESSNRHDVELARRLLGFIPCFDNNLASPAAQHKCAQKWLKSNRKWLHYTGESNQAGSNPYRYEVSLEAKYLQNPLVTVSGPEALSTEEYDRGNRFYGLDTDTKVLLADYSNRLHARNTSRWRRWMRAPLEQQIYQARKYAGLEVGQ